MNKKLYSKIFGMQRIFFLCLFCLFFIPPLSFAIGIAPAEEEFEFNSLGVFEGKGLVVNTDSVFLTVELFEEDPLGILVIDDFDGKDIAPGEEREYSYTIDFPESLDELGELAFIGAMQKTTIGDIEVNVEVKMKIIVVDEIEEEIELNESLDSFTQNNSFWNRIISFFRIFLN